MRRQRLRNKAVRWSNAVLAAILCITMVMQAPSLAQNFPNHTDPAQRLEKPDMSGVPAIRILATSGFPPFSFRLPSGELSGFNIDLAKLICTELEISCTIQSWPFEQAADALADNQGDMLLGGLAITPDNVARFDFSSIYLSFPARLVTQVEDAAGFDQVLLSGQSIGVRSGTVHETFARNNFIQSDIVTFASEIDALEALKTGAVYAYFGDGMRAAFWLNENSDCCQFVLAPFYRPDLFGHGMAMAFPAERYAVRRAVNYALWRLSRNGQMHELFLRWFPVSFY